MNAPSDDFVRKVKLLKVVDGDTLRVEIDLGFGTKLTHDLRLSSVDTPEMRGIEAPAGKFVTKQVKNWLEDREEMIIHSHIFRLGKFGRCLCAVWADGINMNNWLLDSNLGWPTDQDGKIIGPRSLDRLTLPDAVRRRCMENLA